MLMGAGWVVGVCAGWGGKRVGRLESLEAMEEVSDGKQGCGDCDLWGAPVIVYLALQIPLPSVQALVRAPFGAAILSPVGSGPSPGRSVKLHGVG